MFLHVLQRWGKKINLTQEQVVEQHKETIEL
jgi:hypothetical protein